MPDETEHIPANAIIHPEAVASLLSITPDKLAEIRAEQQRLSQLKNSRARLNRDEITRARGAELEQHHLKTGDMDNLAEALAMQGRYREAANVAIRQDLKDHFIEMAEAVDSDDQVCGCDPFRKDGNLNLPNQSDEFRGWSEKHGRNTNFIRCHQCKRLNARAALAHLEDLRRVRAGSTPRKETPADQVFSKV